ncbi:MAG: outer membrane lipoprotein carrier protein LolA [Candidatus Poribacteria bacterium]|nr:outer membrane lipoprotein carrier protein LolA [Candidatus Poribacteria bacterium]
MIRPTYSGTVLGKFSGFRNWILAAMILSVLCANPVHPQGVHEIFQNFKTAYEKSENFSANFEETTLFADKKSVARGRFIFRKPNLLRKEYVDRKDASKVVQLTVLDGEYGWTYTPILNQVNKMKWNNPERRELLPGIGASLEDVQNNYDMALIPDEFANPKGVHQIELQPKRHMVSTNAKESLQIWVKSGEWLPVQFGYKTEFEDGTRQSVIVTLTQIERDKTLAPDLFRFVVPKDAEVIDLSEN